MNVYVVTVSASGVRGRTCKLAVALMGAAAALQLRARDVREAAGTAVRQGIQHGIAALPAFAPLGSKLLLECRGCIIVCL
jgi:hypothetical protein